MRIILVTYLLIFGFLFSHGQKDEVIKRNSIFTIELLRTDSVNYDYKIKSIETILKATNILEGMDLFKDEVPENEIQGILLLNNLVDTSKVFLAIKSGVPKLLECSLLVKHLNNNELKRTKLSIDTLGEILWIYDHEIEIDSFLKFISKSDPPKKILSEDRFILDSIDGVYIPKDLTDCFQQIDSFWDDSTKTMVKSCTEDEFVAKSHHGFGMWIRNNWGLWTGSRLSKYFNEKGIDHADYMSGAILKNYHRYLNGQDIEISTSEPQYLPDSILSF